MATVLFGPPGHGSQGYTLHILHIQDQRAPATTSQVIEDLIDKSSTIMHWTRISNGTPVINATAALKKLGGKARLYLSDIPAACLVAVLIETNQLTKQVPEPLGFHGHLPSVDPRMLRECGFRCSFPLTPL
jgi:hypothetical protein